ncbi:MAG: ABC transporter substrate-binding protein [Limibacillus sp.]
MNFWTARTLAFAAALLSAATFASADGKVTLSTLDWPPYTGSDLPSGGATTEVVRAAFDKIDMEIAVEYRPWKRAIDIALKGTGEVIAYYPGYHCRHRDGFVASEPIGSGPLGFAEHADAPITWDTVDSLGEQQLKIGTVLGYANTDELDKKVGTGWVIAIPSNDDLTNLKKLARKRIDAVVIDKFVLEYLKATEPSLRGYRTKLQFNERPLEDKTLYLCFRDDEAGRAMLERFNNGLKQIDPDRVAEDYFANSFPD